MSQSNKVTIIAEAGVNHNGKVSLALDLIEAAANSGADIIKFQTFNTDNLVTNYSKKAEYQIKNLSEDFNQTQKEMLKQYELKQNDYALLIKKCDHLGIEFFSTGFDLESLKYINNLELKRHKIPSGEITNKPYLKQIAKFKKPIIMSTGMASLKEIKDAVNILFDSGVNKKDLTLLQCTTEYPTPMDEVNLRVINTLRETFDVSVGISDHTEGISVPIAAVALGATVIEKHLTLNKNLKGPDHRASIEPDELKLMVKGIREIERALGSGVKKPSPSEIKNKYIVRKSLVALKLINPGDLFTYDNVGSKRPGYGISPMKIDEIIGKISRKTFKKDELIDL